MTILYDWFATPKTDADGKTTLHARPCFNGTTDTEALARRIQKHTSLTVGNILSVLSELNAAIGEELGNGRQVHLRGLGYFAPTLSVADEVTADMKPQQRNRLVRFKSVSFRPDKALRASIGTPDLLQTHWEAHSLAHSEEETERLLTEFFEKHRFLTRRDLQFLLGLKKTAACSLLQTLTAEGRLQNLGSTRQPVYVPAPGCFGTAPE